MNTDHLPEKAHELLAKTASGPQLDTPEALAQSVLQAITEGPAGWSVDVERLKCLLGDRAVTDPKEDYGLMWPGRAEAEAFAGQEPKNYLRLNVEASEDFEKTKNIYVEGDNLTAMKLLLSKYKGKVKLIYIDPPYNTGTDHVYGDDYSNVDHKDEAQRSASGLKENKSTSGFYHSDWLSMMLPRLMLAHRFLTEDGVIFISIDDNEVANLRQLCDYVFGKNNFVATMVVDGTPKNDPFLVSTAHEYCLCYVKNVTVARTVEYGVSNPYYKDLLELYEKGKGDYAQVEEELKEFYKTHDLQDTNIANYKYADEQGVYRLGPIDDPQSNGAQDVRMNPKTNAPCRVPSRGWSCTKEKWDEWVSQGLIWFPDTDDKLPAKKTYVSKDRLDVIRGLQKIQTRKDTDLLKRLFNTEMTPFANPKPLSLIETFIEGMNDPNCIVMDFFSGSATTAHAVLNCNQKDGGHRRFILVQVREEIDEEKCKSAKMKKIARCAIQYLSKRGRPLNVCELGKERIRLAGKDILKNHPDLDGKLDVGFRVLEVGAPLVNPICFKTATAWAEADIKAFLDSPLNKDVKAEDLLLHALLTMEIPLTATVRQETIAGLNVWCAYDGSILRLVAYVQDVANVIPLNQETLMTFAETLVKRPMRPEFVFMPQDVLPAASAQQMTLFTLLRTHGITLETL